MTSHRIIRKIIIHSEWELKAPLLAGKGEGETHDMEISRYPDDTPYIPGSSIAGVIRSRMLEAGLKNKEWFKWIWGQENNQAGSYQSHFLVNDMVATESITTTVRDSVKIKGSTQTAETQGKYDYEIVDTGATFTWQAEITIREGFKEVEEALQHLNSIFKEGIRVGAFTQTGFGLLCLKKSKWWNFNFSEDGIFEKWIHYCKVCPPSKENPYPEIEIAESALPKANELQFKAKFRLKTSFLTASYESDPKKPDKTQLRANLKPVVSGKSIRGALRHRASRILKTLNVRNVNEHISILFGPELSNNQNQARRSPLRIEESQLPNTPSIQTRIKIDRFTGGVMPGALLEEEPVWATSDNENNLTISLCLKNAEGWQVALLLFLIKDLWLSDLPIGGAKAIGRGILEGRTLEIMGKYKGNDVDIKIESKPSQNENLIINEKATDQVNLWQKEWTTFIQQQNPVICHERNI